MTHQPPTPMTEPGLSDPPPRADVVVQRIASVAALRHRRLAVLPVNGPGAPVSRPQGRGPGYSTTLTGPADLISSIAAVGVLCPILVEELDTGGDVPLRWIVAGERRVMSIRRGAVSAPANPHFGSIPAVVCPGPLSEEERRTWQLVENLAREDLQPGELAAALLFERCAVLTTHLAEAGVDVEEAVADEPDPVMRYQLLERLRCKRPNVGAPWPEVLRRLGLRLSPRKARAVVSALVTLPREMSTDMDAHKVALHTRLQLLEVGTGVDDPAAELWAEVKRRGRSDLLAGAIRAFRSGAGDPEDAVAAAEADRNRANAARSQSLRRDSSADTDATPAGPPVPAAAVTATLTALRDLVGHLNAGRQLSRFDAGSVRLLTGELLQLVTGRPGARRAT
jgi:ParB family chromosome partitioning protein